MSTQTYVTPEELRSALSKQPRTSLAHLPTPLDECQRLSEALSPTAKGPRIFIKRDDLTGQALGGNKVRHLEFRIGDALALGCDTFLYADPYNAARCTAAACAKVGMGCVLVVHGHKETELQGNLLLAHLLGAELVFLDTDIQREAWAQVPVVRQRLEQEGRKPYAVQEMPWFNLSAMFSYLDAGLELAKQLRERRIDKGPYLHCQRPQSDGLAAHCQALGPNMDVYRRCYRAVFRRGAPSRRMVSDGHRLPGILPEPRPGRNRDHLRLCWRGTQRRDSARR